MRVVILKRESMKYITNNVVIQKVSQQYSFTVAPVVVAVNSQEDFLIQKSIELFYLISEDVEKVNLTHV
tara:strand:- start:659 stop:865 length:207 start_codon:yes stop_codon:yes gene_type:complete